MCYLNKNLQANLDIKRHSSLKKNTEGKHLIYIWREFNCKDIILVLIQYVHLLLYLFILYIIGKIF